MYFIEYSIGILFINFLEPAFTLFICIVQNYELLLQINYYLLNYQDCNLFLTVPIGFNINFKNSANRTNVIYKRKFLPFTLQKECIVYFEKGFLFLFRIGRAVVLAVDQQPRHRNLFRERLISALFQTKTATTDTVAMTPPISLDHHLRVRFYFHTNK